jgi:hypothetical protein
MNYQIVHFSFFSYFILEQYRLSQSLLYNAYVNKQTPLGATVYNPNHHVYTCIITPQIALKNKPKKHQKEAAKAEKYPRPIRAHAGALGSYHAFFEDKIIIPLRHSALKTT